MRKRPALTAMALLLLIATVWTSYQWYDIKRIGRTTEPAPADVAIILGAAVWDGRPSPALRERLDVAVTLHRQGLVAQLICTGGVGSLHPTPEAVVCADYLREQGIPPTAILVEDQSTRTWENLANAAELMKQHGMQTALVVTHGFHMKRALLQARALGIAAHGAPVPETVLFEPYFILREIAALTYMALGGR